jgi:hypothetical protein
MSRVEEIPSSQPNRKSGAISSDWIQDGLSDEQSNENYQITRLLRCNYRSIRIFKNNVFKKTTESIRFINSEGSIRTHRIVHP